MSGTLQRFLIIAMARTGSNAVISAFRQHPGIYADFELFHPSHIPGPIGQGISLPERDADPEAFLDKAVATAINLKPATTHYGFKIFFGQNDALMDRLLDSPDWSVVVLKRSNILDQFLSLKIAQQTQQWASPEGRKTAKVVFNEQDFLRFHGEAVSHYSKLSERLANKRTAFIDLSYDDIAAGNYGLVCRFLGVAEPHSLVPLIEKQNPAGTADKLQNPEEAHQTLERCGLLHYWVK